MHANKSANVYFYCSENNAIESDKSLPGKQFDCSTAFAFFGPLSVASKSVICQGEMTKDGHFSMDKPGWRIHAALKQGTLFEGSPGAFPGPTRPGCPLFFIWAWLLLLCKQKKSLAVQAKQGVSESEELSGNKRYRFLWNIQVKVMADFVSGTDIGYWGGSGLFNASRSIGCVTGFATAS